MEQKLSYCNPLCIEDIKSGRWLDTQMVNEARYPDYRSISDPSVIYHDGKWIMYPSYAVAYVTEDFVHWKHVDIGVPHMRYSPAVVQFRGKWYLSGHDVHEVYVADDPLGPFTLAGRLTDCHGNEVLVEDQCYLADGDRLYMYWFGIRKPVEGESVYYVTGTLGAEMDPNEPWKMLTEPVWLNQFDPGKRWQCAGEYNQDRRMGWIEGQWAIKAGERIYILYCGSGTRYSSYANGVIYSDDGPLGPFHEQKNHTPLTEKRTGFVRGAGHGSIAPGPNNTWWVFYTNIFCYGHRYERRVSMDPLGIDEDGELFCPGCTDTPQYAPGVLEHPELGNSLGLLPLTFLQHPEATSYTPGRDPIYACDESVLTWWQPEHDDPHKCITFPLSDYTAFQVEAVRVIWRDVGMETLRGIDPGPIQYVVEACGSPTGEDWKILVDASQNDRDLNIDYRSFDPVIAYKVRLRILGAPKGIQPGLISLTAFGTCANI